MLTGDLCCEFGVFRFDALDLLNDDGMEALVVNGDILFGDG